MASGGENQNGITPRQGYAGDITETASWQILSDNTDAVLIDVRTMAEWAFVGLPDLSSVGKEVLRVEWVQFPDMAPNGQFAEQVEQQLQSLGGRSADTPLLFLCRSGQRSQGAAMALTQKGYQACYNVVHGFEGDKDADGHRGKVNGWKVEGLPWQQG